MHFFRGQLFGVLFLLELMIVMLLVVIVIVLG